ncbi:hypothetical protein [Chamaesiphon sp. VAR_48_metabat_403]|uniref:hypothetical protein n=1 Tax=Chamaesiphon sp. VAR_48_metabat_403 TaxID=2964700 RepID=UPI00286DBBE4|nr:hypothetical protein [Chamaesiphon sp. VAR_48_metabat_403]
MKGNIERVAAIMPPPTAGDSSAQLASNPNTQPQLLRKLGTAADCQLRQLVAGNPNTPLDLLWQLGIDFPEVILANPIFELLQIEQPHLVAQIPAATLTSLLQCEGVPKRFMEYAVNQQDYSLWLAVAYNPHTPGELLENLARKSRAQDRELIRAVAAHPNTPTHVLAQIVNIGGNVAQIVATNLQTPVPILEQILRKYGQSSDPTFATLIALHPQIAVQLLIQMNLAPSDAAARSLWLAKQSATDADTLGKLAATDWHVLHLAIVRHPNTPSQTIDLIWHKMVAARTECPLMDRLIYDSFVINAHTSAQLREELRKLLKW